MKERNTVLVVSKWVVVTFVTVSLFPFIVESWNFIKIGVSWGLRAPGGVCETLGHEIRMLSTIDPVSERWTDVRWNTTMNRRRRVFRLEGLILGIINTYIGLLPTSRTVRHVDVKKLLTNWLCNLNHQVHVRIK